VWSTHLFLPLSEGEGKRSPSLDPFLVVQRIFHVFLLEVAVDRGDLMMTKNCLGVANFLQLDLPPPEIFSGLDWRTWSKLSPFVERKELRGLPLLSAPLRFFVNGGARFIFAHVTRPLESLFIDLTETRAMFFPFVELSPDVIRPVLYTIVSHSIGHVGFKTSTKS